MDYATDRVNMRNTVDKLKREQQETCIKFQRAEDAVYYYYHSILLPMEQEQEKYTDDQFDEVYDKYGELIAERDLLEDSVDDYETAIKHLTDVLELIELW